MASAREDLAGDDQTIGLPIPEVSRPRSSSASVARACRDWRMFLIAASRVSGPDRRTALPCAAGGRGADVHVGHDAAKVPDDVDSVVHTGAISPGTPDSCSRKKHGLYVIHVRRRCTGDRWTGAHLRRWSHGKTTSTGRSSPACRQLEGARLRQRRRHRGLGVSVPTGSTTSSSSKRTSPMAVPALRHGRRTDHQRRSRPYRSLGPPAFYDGPSASQRPRAKLVVI